jgi:hypothetical protein
MHEDAPDDAIHIFGVTDSQRISTRSTQMILTHSFDLPDTLRSSNTNLTEDVDIMYGVRRVRTGDCFSVLQAHEST